MKRIFDILFSFVLIILLLPFWILIPILIVMGSKGGVFFFQSRVGKGNRDFRLFKFRTMATNSESKGQLTVGANDSRITKIGYYLRKYKIDELPQLFNVLIGNMSIVGPRPEVRKYVEMYTEEQLKVLSVRPGITDEASIQFINENEMLGKSENPERDYIEKIMPEKLRINLEYIKKKSLGMDLRIVLKTAIKIIK